MFKNLYTEKLKVINNSSTTEVNAMVVIEQKRDFNSIADNIFKKYCFIIEYQFEINMDSKLEYDGNIFEIDTITICRNIDNSHKYYKIATL